MGIHYDYKSTEETKLWKRKRKEKHVSNKEELKNQAQSKETESETMHDINKPITLEDLTNPDKN